MRTQQLLPQVTKAAVSVTEMAEMVGLSRARFYDLIGSVFPLPCYDVRTRRPLFTQEQQQDCLEIRRTNRGMDGQPVVFFLPRKNRPTGKPAQAQPARRDRRSSRSGPDHGLSLVESLKALGLQTSPEQVASAMGELFPEGTEGIAHGEVIRSVFRYLRRLIPA